MMLKKKQMRSTKNTRMVFDLSKPIDAGILDKDMSRVPNIKSAREAIEFCTKGIHGIPDIFRSIEGIRPEHLKVYVGITNNPLRRFLEHSRNSKGQYFCLIGKSPGKKISEYEALGVKFLKFLIHKKSLCVGELINLKERSKSINGTAYLYVIFSIDKRLTSFGKLNSSRETLSKYSAQFEYILEESRIKAVRDLGWLPKALKLTSDLKIKSRLVYCL
jgi:hypothetical protein